MIIELRQIDLKEKLVSDSYNINEWLKSAASLRAYPADPSLIWQMFSGLCDKRGEKIFDGDILLFASKVKLWVHFEDGCFVASNDDQSHLLIDVVGQSEVVGHKIDLEAERE